MKRLIAAAFLASLLPLLAVRASACSAVSCLNKGFEMRRDFAVAITHENRPLAGVKVEVTTTGTKGKETQQFSGLTAADGTVHVVNLSPGEYWLHAELLGVTAAYHCFYVPVKPSRKAKRALSFQWGDWAPATRRVAGRLVDCQPGNGDNPFRSLARCVQLPITGSRIKLQSPITGATYSTSSDENGSFIFGSVPKGTYVLHVEGGGTPARDYDSTDLLIKVHPNASWNMLVLTRRDPGGGSCGGTSLGLTKAND